MEILAEARSATMRFGEFTAVHGVDLSVNAGEVVGLLGANGAGKTTLIRMLLGLLAPSRGSVALFGGPPSREARRKVGYVPQTLGLYNTMTVDENWAFTAAAFGIAEQTPPASIAAARQQLVGDLSLGLQRRVAFAVALSHDPQLLVLDEPTSGVGPLSSAGLWGNIRAGAEHGIGVLVTTHNMKEAEQCDRLIVMSAGRVVAAGTLEQVIGGRHVVRVDCDDWRAAFTTLDADGLIVQVESGHLRVPGTPQQVQDLLGRHQLVGDVSVVAANLEEAFVEIITNAPPR